VVGDADHNEAVEALAVDTGHMLHSGLVGIDSGQMRWEGFVDVDRNSSIAFETACQSHTDHPLESYFSYWMKAAMLHKSVFVVND